MMTLPEGQRTKDKAWEPSIKENSFGSQGALDRKRLPLLFIFMELIDSSVSA